MKRILLVEDEEMIREMYKLAIQNAGYQIDTSEDGESAALKINTTDPQYDLVLLDIMLPKLDGISVLKQIKADDKTKNIPVFLLTNLGLEDLVKEALELGAQQYLVKSNILPKQIVAEIDTFFQQK